MLHSFRLFRIASMLENWHQMVGNWLETIDKYMNIYNARMRLWYFCGLVLDLAWSIVFSLCALQWFKNLSKLENIYKILIKKLYNSYKTTFREKCVKIIKYMCRNFINYFPTCRSTKHFVDRVSADYNGHYIQEPSKSDKYGFFWCLPEFWWG